jgi:hypothetical protein
MDIISRKITLAHDFFIEKRNCTAKWMTVYSSEKSNNRRPPYCTSQQQGVITAELPFDSTLKDELINYYDFATND